MYNALQYSHQLLKSLVQKNPKGLFIDATLGNGHDSAFILSLKDFTGTLIGFDIQEIAIQNSISRINSLNNPTKATYKLLLESHEHVAKYINEEPIQGAIFNLGYLPGGDHTLTTVFSSTYKSMQDILLNLALHGQIILVIYSGHESGMVEKNNLTEVLKNLPQEKYQVLSYQFINQINNPPMLLVIERIK
ncbi:class I SAM-dependent methyltransferase [Aerococcaceae bacterium DSM 111021]|nr:class I SAM-dependent methyltransferase [Aerococcaceae bacterium DSM 111021]